MDQGTIIILLQNNAHRGEADNEQDFEIKKRFCIYFYPARSSET